LIAGVEYRIGGAATLSNTNLDWRACECLGVALLAKSVGSLR
jgi:hypothetical protein